MSKDTLTQLLEKNQLDVRQERIKRPNLTIWNLIQNELGGAYVLSLATGGGAGMGVARVIQRTPAAEDIWIRKIIEGFQRYDELEKLSETEIKSKLTVLFRLEIEREQQAYIAKLRLKADFPYWLKMATWTWEEGAALIHGLEPRTVKPANRDSTREVFPTIKSWLESRDHALRAIRAGQLKYYSKPIEFLKWAESLGYPIPGGLQVLFAKNEAKTKPAELLLTWKTTASTLGEKILQDKPLLSLEQISNQVHKIMLEKHQQGEQGVTGRGNRVPAAETIMRHGLKGLKTTRHSGNAS